MRKAIIGMILFTATAIGCDDSTSKHVHDEESELADGLWLIGEVRYHDAGFAIGGETDPYGYILVGNHKETIERYLKQANLCEEERKKIAPLVYPLHSRLYLGVDGSLEHLQIKQYNGRRVKVKGTLGMISAGGIETPLRHFYILNITDIRLD